MNYLNVFFIDLPSKQSLVNVHETKSLTQMKTCKIECSKTKYNGESLNHLYSCMGQVLKDSMMEQVECEQEK